MAKLAAKLAGHWKSCCRCVFFFCGCMVGTVAWGQEALNNSIAGQANSESRAQQLQSQDYTFKYGDFRSLISATADAAWNDNINLTKSGPLDDYILTPSLRVTSSYPVTQDNVLFFDISIGYSRYLKHPNYSTFNLNSSSGTGVSFDIGIKDVTINLHDWMHYSQDAAQNSTVANTGNYGTFDNSAGLSASWDLNQVTLSAGYDHANVLSTSAEFDGITHQSELFFVRSGFLLHPQVTVGLESTATLTTYKQNVFNNNDAYTIGAYATFSPDSALHITARGGYTTYKFQQDSASLRTSDQNSYYAALNVNHQPLDWLSYSLDAGHEVQLGTQSDLTEDWYLRPSVTWKFIKKVEFNTAFFYEHGQQGLGNVFGNLTENYDWYGGEFTVNHDLTSRLTIGMNYRLTIRSSDISNNEYTQNLVGLHLTYHPQ
jgi:hypothetical protein